jgi:hypothetical protein
MLVLWYISGQSNKRKGDIITDNVITTNTAIIEIRVPVRCWAHNLTIDTVKVK